MNNITRMNESFLEEYRSTASIQRYTRKTAGHGINYLLNNVYGSIYLKVLEQYVPQRKLRSGIRVLEFGCGGSMNLLHLISILDRRGFALEIAYGTDFSDTLIEAANREASEQLIPEQRNKVHFCVAKNESLVTDMSLGLRLHEATLLGSFDLIIGVNTIRYCHRIGKQLDCTRGIHRLLAPGGVCVVIDMNKGFPLFRSRLRDRLTKDKEACYLPSLQEYALPFSTVGFEILQQKHFCWVPHSAGPWLTSVLKALTPALNTLAPEHAMRSLIISRKRS
jgi:SAM-dependent methyltransferase